MGKNKTPNTKQLEEMLKFYIESDENVREQLESIIVQYALEAFYGSDILFKLNSGR